MEVIFQTPGIDSPDEYSGFWITGEINADGFMEIKVILFVKFQYSLGI